MNPVVLGIVLFFIFGGIGVKTVIDSSIPTTYDLLFQKYGALYAVNWKLLKRICFIESSIGRHERVKRGLENPYDIEGSKSEDGKSWGIMQLRPSTAQDFDKSADPIKLNNPEYSVKIAAQFVAWIQNRFPSSDPRFEEWVVKSYNQGAGGTANERAGKTAGAAGPYWKKYLDASQKIA